jgi:polysaccharide biosynthesis/export protein
MQSKSIRTLTISLGLLIGSFLISAKAEDQPQGQTAQGTTAPAQTAVKAAPAPATTAEPKPVATLEKIPEKGGYALAIPSNLPGYVVPSTISESESVKYTLGADDIIEVTVMRHPEFSGTFPINSEGKIQLKFASDINVMGLTKKQVEDKIAKVLASFLLSPEVNVTITEYKSKYVFVLGEVAQPGKYYIKSETISVRDAVVNSGLPTYSAAMRKCSLITPDKSGKVQNKPVNIYAILYIGDLRKNIDMHPGDVLYVPSTVMAKVIRIISPVATTVGLASSPATDTGTAKTAAKAMAF